MSNSKRDDLNEIEPKVLKNINAIASDSKLGDGYTHVKKVKLPSGSYYVKDLEAKRAVASAVSANMYTDIGISTAPVRVFKDKTTNKNSLMTIQPDITDRQDIITILAKNNTEFNKISQSFLTRYKWQILSDYDLQNRLLQHITPECLAQLQDVFLIDEIRTDSDRTTKNYFYYKAPNSKLWEGVIVIDLEQMQLYNYCGTRKDDFDSFIYTQYGSATPQQTEDNLTYKQRIFNLRELVDAGLMSPRNIETMIKALRYDLPKDAKFLCREQKLSYKQKNEILTPLSRLWNYNQKTLGKDLGL